MRPLGAIVVGIGAYHYDREHFPLLRYAANDAIEIERYLTTCWPRNEDICLIRLVDEQATLQAIRDAFAKLAQEESYDLQIIFLSGHGLVDSDRAAFVVQPSSASTSLSLLNYADLDELLRSVPAKQTILILDCCYAEGITRRMDFFGTLGQSDAHLFIASSREQQRTWEDDRVGHGIFTAYLLDLLRTGSSVKLNGIRDVLDVDSELFPVLCNQVPLYVFEQKQQRQEPVKGGVSTRPVTLPVARAVRRIRSRSAFGAAVARLRQIVFAAASVALAFLFFAYQLAYYAESDRNGDVQLHHGTKWLAPLFRFLPTLRADTGISTSDLSSDPSTRYPIQAGETAGLWTHLSRRGYRAWYENVRASLDSKAVTRYDVLVATNAPRPVYQLTDDSRPSEIANAAWALLDNSDSNQLNMLFGHVLGADRASPILTRFSLNDMDFNILDRTQPDLANFADALRYTAAVDPDRSFTPYLAFLKANQIWLAHSSSEQHGSEAGRRAAEDVADILSVITTARSDRGEPPLNSDMIAALHALAEAGFGDLVHLAISRAPLSPAERNAEASRALAAFHGNPEEPQEALALRQLTNSLDSSSSSRAIAEKAYKRLVSAVGPEEADLTGFLIAAADKQAMPSSVLNGLVEKARDAVVRKQPDFVDTEHARILAHAMSQIPTASRPVVYELIDLVTGSVTPMASSTAEIYTALGRQKLETPAMFQRIVEEARAAPPYRPESPDVIAEPLPGLSIVVGHGPWLEALAVLGANRILPRKAIEILQQHANDPSVRDDIVRALAHQPEILGTPCSSSSCCRILRVFAKDGPMRQLASDVLAEKLAALPRKEFLDVLQSLRNERASEIEPEVRIALGQTIINAQLARVRTTPVGSQLFQ